MCTEHQGHAGTHGHLSTLQSFPSPGEPGGSDTGTSLADTGQGASMRHLLDVPGDCARESPPESPFLFKLSRPKQVTLYIL